MHYLKYFLLPLLLCSITLLSACGGDDTKKITTVDNPEVDALAYFHALYNEKNLNKSASVRSQKRARLILHYRSPGAVARHLFNMSYDKVEMRPDSGGVKVREQFKGSANITVYFDGYYQEKRIKEVKRLALIQIDGKWFIDKILKDPF